MDVCWAGHNAPDAPFVLESCRFERFVNFDDEWFKGPVMVRECAFARGTNLLGMRGWPNQVRFDVAPILERIPASLTSTTTDAPDAGRHTPAPGPQAPSRRPQAQRPPP